MDPTTSNSNSKSNNKRPRSLSTSPGPLSSAAPAPPMDTRPDCQYGQNCYRRNPTHFREYKHKILENLYKTLTNSSQDLSKIPKDLQAGFDDISTVIQQLKMLKDGNYEFLSSTITTTAAAPARDFDKATEIRNHGQTAKKSRQQCPAEPEVGETETVPAPNSRAAKVPKYVGSSAGTSSSSFSKSGMSQKWARSCPYNFFLTRTPREPDVPYSVSFLDIFDKSFGDIKAICHFNFMVEAEWLIDQSMQGNLENIPTTIIYGIETPELAQASKVFPWLKIHLAKSPFPYGHHHTKMILIQYTDESLRFVIMTANLIESDWENRTQGVWISPKCPKTTNEKGSDSRTKFKSDLLQYLSTYPPVFLYNWTSLIKSTDCSDVKVVFIGSAPTTAQSSTNGFQWGLKKMESVMTRVPQPDDIDPTWPLLMQCSSIATLGPSDDWLRGELGSSMLGKSWAPQTSIRVIYPSDSNVRSSVDGIHGGGCLPYNKSTHAKQLWLQKILFQWKSSLRNRTQIMPHIKTYCRVSSDYKKLGWFLLTSSNLSKAAWGKLTKNHDRLTVMSWEAGVLFLPHYFESNEPFTISQTSAPAPAQGNKQNEFMIPYDVPLQKYNPNDQPWFIDTLMELRPKT